MVFFPLEWVTPYAERACNLAIREALLEPLLIVCVCLVRSNRPLHRWSGYEYRIVIPGSLTEHVQKIEFQIHHSPNEWWLSIINKTRETIFPMEEKKQQFLRIIVLQPLVRRMFTGKHDRNFGLNEYSWDICIVGQINTGGKKLSWIWDRKITAR